MTGAREYGRALFMLGEETDALERIADDARLVQSVLSRNPEYIKLLDTPAVSLGEKLALIEEAFGSLEKNLVNFLKLLTQKRRANIIFKAIGEFISEYELSQGIERAEAVSAVALTEKQILALKTRLEGLTGKTVIVTNTVNPDILGGMKLRYMGRQLDGSLKARLDAIENNLQSLVI